MTVISPQDFVRLHGGINGWRPDQAAIDAYIAINSGALPLADYQQQLAAMADAQYHPRAVSGGGGGSFGALAPAAGAVAGAAAGAPAAAPAPTDAARAFARPTRNGSVCGLLFVCSAIWRR
jgi:hypothetical protein